MEEEEEEEENEVNRPSNGDAAALPTIVLPNQVADSNSTTNKSDVAANPKAAAADTPAKPAAPATPKGATLESPKSKKNKSPSLSTKKDKKDKKEVR